MNQNLEAEESVLGAMMVSESTIKPVLDVHLRAEDFYRDRHRTIYEAIIRLHENADPVDVLTVSEALAQHGQLDQIGGRDVVASLAAKVPAPGSASHYAEIVKRNAELREADATAKSVQAAVREGHLNGQLPELVERLQRLTEAARLRVRSADLARVRPVTWAWERRFPLGYLSLILGAEGMGKGTLIAWVIAQATRGTLRGDLAGEPTRVLIVGDEDSFDSVVVPRLYAAGANLDWVEALTEEDDMLDLRRDAGQLRSLLQAGGHRIVYLDALLDTLGVDIDDWRSKPVRDALRPLRRLARELDVCVVASLHPNKGARSSFRDLVSGTHAFNASSRSSLFLAAHPEDSERRVIVRGKGNLSAPPPSFEFAIEGRDLEINGHGFSLPVVADQVEGELSVDEILKPPREAQVRDTLAEQIHALGTGEIQTRADLARALGRNPDDRSVGRALDQLEAEDRWTKVGRGQWRRLGIGTSSEVPMPTLGGER